MTMRVPQLQGTKGSLRWIQAIVNAGSTMLTDAVRAANGLPSDWDATWVSPKATDDHSEYRDGEFLDVLKLGHLRNSLAEFWPTGGPQWDALATTTTGGVILVEAKAHTGEVHSSLQASDPRSVEKITAALRRTQEAYGAESGSDWSKGYYQYANRLAHLHFLRTHNVDALLAFVYFVGDKEMGGPTSKAGWRGVLDAQYAALSLSAAPPRVCHVFIDVALTPPRVAV